MIEFCPWESAQNFLYSSNVPTLFFYSHIPAVVAALFVGFWVFFKNKKSGIGIVLLAITVIFSLWSIFDLILWATNNPKVVMFFWSMQILIEPLIYLLGFGLAYLFIRNKGLSFRAQLMGFLAYAPIPILLATTYNLIGVNLSDCTAIEGIIARYFTYIIEIIFIIFILVTMDREYRMDTSVDRRKEIITFALGMIVFLLAFSWGNLIGSFTENWNIAQAGLIGMPIFVGFLAYVIVKFHSFNVKLFGAQALVLGIVILVGSQFFFIEVFINKVLNSATFIVVVIFGYLLISSVKKEVKQREELQKLNIELQALIKQRESLMHLINHKVKGSFTHSKYVFAGMLDGTFGEINDEVKRRAEQGLEANDTGIKTIDLVLNAANMQKGVIKYDMKQVDFKEIVSSVIADKKIPAENKNLVISTTIVPGNYHALGDAFWLKEAVNNLLENSIKYTKKGSIDTNLEAKDGKILLTVKDTGVGITEEDKKNLFTEGGRGKDSVKVNVDSTGYGLYSVKLIVEAHKGRVWAKSEGAEKGSQFYIELPQI
ncbi:MAG: HAMP domain-containing histidine kinase [Candidatus Pacebacteria bacterium]|nr:HAMP domain-containing histidine kinase [Candidatus Paceibacterota bacterium]